MFTVVGGKPPDRPTNTQPVITDTLWELAIRCWGTNHATRPAIDKIVQDMSGGEHLAEVEPEKEEEPQPLGWSMPTLPAAPMEDRYQARTQSPPQGCVCVCTRQEYPSGNVPT